MNEPGWLADYQYLHGAAGVIDLPGRTVLEIRGDDRASFLHNLCTNDVRRLVVGSGCEAFITNVQGKTLAHVRVFAQPEALVVEAAPGLGEKLVQHLEKYHIREKVEVADHSQSRAEMLLCGPGAEAVLRAHTSELPAAMLGSTEVELAGDTIWLRRVDFTVTPSFLIECARSHLPVVRSVLAKSEVIICAWEAFDAARVEAGYPLAVQDVTDRNLPQEVGRDVQAISFTKGCYLGQETVARIDALGHVNRMLTGIACEGAQIPAPGTELVSESQNIGYVTSAAYSPRLARPLALAYVRRERASPGTRLDCSGQTAEVVSLPVNRGADFA